ncbi:phage integrase N-terminal SAM-like domain-containing protein [Synechococcus sp. BA-132 BA5]|uniref:phage integrase N-terminal SAM-like domain-containing protein n=1 Tax=Synechococcus sp. BA-132 BA5 TaxID=3110252 RepID=UPI002B1FCAD9|nr:phage integrase N-terminal SAM-like domain-containing protein [Synechococcus sp. BA-132 BA5]MEA5415566.1 phage integrase N-terminal SAM-like domain-containing protein [Synechococcus sp. BA-132 BA5]
MRFDQLYAEQLQALTLQGKRSKTIDGYARDVRRIAGFFNRWPDDLTTADLNTYFAWMAENYSWSSVKVDLWGLSEVDGFYWKDSAPDIVNPGREEQGLFSV